MKIGQIIERCFKAMKENQIYCIGMKKKIPFSLDLKIKVLGSIWIKSYKDNETNEVVPNEVYGGINVEYNREDMEEQIAKLLLPQLQKLAEFMNVEIQPTGKVLIGFPNGFRSGDPLAWGRPGGD